MRRESSGYKSEEFGRYGRHGDQDVQAERAKGTKIFPEVCVQVESLFSSLFSVKNPL
jgi:hypothetical protein